MKCRTGKKEEEERTRDVCPKFHFICLLFRLYCLGWIWYDRCRGNGSNIWHTCKLNMSCFCLPVVLLNVSLAGRKAERVVSSQRIGFILRSRIEYDVAGRNQWRCPTWMPDQRGPNVPRGKSTCLFSEDSGEETFDQLAKQSHHHHYPSISSFYSPPK